ncbi:MAG: S26 family signal peptidase, partial [Pirellula sp.]
MKTTSLLPDENPQELRARRPSRWFVAATLGLLVFLILGLVGAYLLMRQSHVVRVGRIAGSSMEPALRGPRLELVCTNCQSSNSWTYDAWNPSREARCRFCREYLDTSDPKVTQGETIRYVPIPRLRPSTARRPSGSQSDLVDRWDILVLEARQDDNPEANQANQVKRVVGLPGESIRIAQGRIYADGKPIVPNLTEFMQQAVLIAHWELGSNSPSENQSGENSPSKTLEEYLSGFAAPIDNALPINAHDSHHPVAVSDIGIAMRLAQPQSNWNLKFQLAHGDQRVPIELSCYEKDTQVTLVAPGIQEGTDSVSSPSPPSPSPQIGWIRSWQPTWIHVVVLGGRLIVFDERQEQWSVALEPMQEGLRWTELSLVDPPGLIDRCMIYRGLHYRGIRDSPEQEFAAAEGWIVLGDNGTISEDSRYWERPRIDRDELRGILEPRT